MKLFFKHRKQLRGFTIFIAVLTASLLLAVGAAIYALASQEAVFASVAKNSDYALYVADTGVECALYWNNACTTAINPACSKGSAFATSSTSNPPTSGIMCNGQDIAQEPPSEGYWPITTGADAATPTAATSTFQIDFPAQGGQPASCADVTVGISADSSGFLHTNILSEGYNICTGSGGSANPNRLERELKWKN